ncbi:hypothetical protein HN51_054978, partial [Arachis hypogaea]
GSVLASTFKWELGAGEDNNMFGTESIVSLPDGNVRYDLELQQYTVMFVTSIAGLSETTGKCSFYLTLLTVSCTIQTKVGPILVVINPFKKVSL